MKSNYNILIAILRIVSCTMVVLIHSGNANAGWLSMEYIWTRFIPAGAVPLFFLISGYLLSSKVILLRLSTERQRYVLGRMTDAAGSYIAWILIFWAIFEIAVSLKLIVSGFYYDKIKDGPLSIFGVTDRYPVIFQFWFLRELILFHVVYLIVTPILNYILRIHIFVVGMMLFILIASVVSLTGYDYSPERVNFSLITIVCFFSYWLGAIIANLSASKDVLAANFWVKVSFACISYLVFVAAVFLVFGEVVGVELVASVVVLVCLARLLAGVVSRKFALYMSAPTYWVFVVHGLMIALLSKLGESFGLFDTWGWCIVFVTTTVVSFATYYCIPARLRLSLSLLVDMKSGLANRN